MCAECSGCGAAAEVICVGRDGDYAMIGGESVLLRRAVPDRVFCCVCAMAAGWPWLESERRVRA